MSEILNIENRNCICLQGATKVVSSTNTQAIVCSESGSIIISGTGLEVTKLDLDNKLVSFSGNITGIKFTKTSEKVSFIKRIFK